MNTLHITGRMLRDPERKTVGEGTDMVKFGVAENSGKGKYERKLFMECVMFGRQCQFVMDYFHKGDPIEVSGQLDTETWDDNDTGKKRSRNVLNVKSVGFVPRQSEQPKQQQELPQSEIPADEVPF